MTRGAARCSLRSRGPALLILVACNRSRDARPETPVVLAQSAPPAPSPLSAAPPANTYPYDDIAWVDSLIDKRIDMDSVVRSDTLAPGVVCYTLPRYLVVEKPTSHDEVGNDIIVRRRTATAACGADSVAGDFVKRNQWAEYFLAMRGDRLFLDSGTGNVRGVLVFDVPAAKQITSFTGDIAGWRDSTTLIAWIAGDDSVPHARCPKVPDALEAVLDSLVAIDLRANTRVALNRVRCAGRE